MTSPGTLRTRRARANLKIWAALLGLWLAVASNGSVAGQDPAPSEPTPSPPMAATDPDSLGESDDADRTNPADADPTSDDETEVLRAVVRVSWQMIDRLADDQIDADVPFETSLMDGQLSGRVQSRADITIRMQELPRDARFTIVADGTARGNYAASRGPLRLNGPLAIPFRATKAVSFDGRRFVARETNVDASIGIDFHCIGWRRRGPLGRLAARLVTPAVLREAPNIEQSAAPLANEYVANFVDQEMESLVTELNQVSEVEASMLRVYPQLQDWTIRLSSTSDHLEARFAPRDSEPIVLPQDPRRPMNAGFELWIRTTAAEAKVLERIGGWNQSQQLLKTYLDSHDVNVEDMSSQAQVVAIDDWLVVALGQAVTATSTSASEVAQPEADRGDSPKELATEEGVGANAAQAADSRS